MCGHDVMGVITLLPVLLLLDMHLMQGDELRLRYVGGIRPPWEGIGHVTEVPNSILLSSELARTVYTAETLAVVAWRYGSIVEQ